MMLGPPTHPAGENTVPEGEEKPEGHSPTPLEQLPQQREALPREQVPDQRQIKPTAPFGEAFSYEGPVVQDGDSFTCGPHHRDPGHTVQDMVFREQA